MRSPRSYQPGRRSGNAAAFDRLFVARVHRLLELGYCRLLPSQYAREEETAVTGDLVGSIEHVLDYPAEKWMPFYSVYDDPSVNEPRRRGTAVRKGRRRRRVDIRVDSSEISPRARFRFECKRLGNGHPAGEYLGMEGLGCFLRGEYACEDVRAGMLGYIQSSDEATWARKIEVAMTRSSEAFCVQVPWQHSPVSEVLQHAYRSTHGRASGREPIEIYHTLLRFH